MRPILAVVLFAVAPLVAMAAGRQTSVPPAPSVKVGQAAPNFTLQYLAASADGKFQEKSVSLADFKGKKTVILAFFPAAFSPG